MIRTVLVAALVTAAPASAQQVYRSYVQTPYGGTSCVTQAYSFATYTRCWNGGDGGRPWQTRGQLAKLCLLMLGNWQHPDHAATVKDTCERAGEDEIKERGGDMALVSRVLSGEGVKAARRERPWAKGGMCDDAGGTFTVPDVCRRVAEAEAAR